MSLRLYYDDPALLAFDATVVACEPHAGGFRVALDRSAFYPSSGGQPHDLGHLRADGRVLAVSDVVADDQDQVWHHVSESLEPGSHVLGEIDRVRRHDFRQQHSGQHILSAAFDHLVSATDRERASRARGLHARSASRGDAGRVSPRRGPTPTS